MSSPRMSRNQAFLGFQRVLGAAIGLASIVFGLLVVQPVIGQAASLEAWWSAPAVLVVFGVPALLGLVSVRGSGPVIRTFAGAGAIGYLLVMVSWQAVLLEPLGPDDESPWINSVAAIATASAATAFRRPTLVWGYLLVICALVGVNRFSAAGDGSVVAPLLDALFSVMFCAVFTALALVAQRGARLLDEAAASAGSEVIQSATIQARDRERSRFEALMHDGILATLLIASDDRPGMRADLARQARATLTRLEILSADTVDDEVLSPTDFVRVQQAVVTEIDPAAHFSDVTEGVRMIPGDVSAAISEALSEALRNSLRHAGAHVARAVHATVTDDVVEVAVIDDGDGFDLAAVPQNRMGVVVSIVGRMQRLDGGDAEIASHPGRGTAVSLRWRR
ncbi:MAG: hypothetical protein RI885_1562 [Actinomycetota bacterium]